MALDFYEKYFRIESSRPIHNKKVQFRTVKIKFLAAEL